mmetsp:Transcript_33263/g.80429  ORF Transcript_33263/g.80429 Transcript_33263/m.80429 type:complete len:217 (-) Transcript_33263:65-715(-)
MPFLAPAVIQSTSSLNTKVARQTKSPSPQQREQERPAPMIRTTWDSFNLQVETMPIAIGSRFFRPQMRPHAPLMGTKRIWVEGRIPVTVRAVLAVAVSQRTSTTMSLMEFSKSTLQLPPPRSLHHNSRTWQSTSSNPNSGLRTWKINMILSCFVCHQVPQMAVGLHMRVYQDTSVCTMMKLACIHRLQCMRLAITWALHIVPIPLMQMLNMAIDRE